MKRFIHNLLCIFIGLTIGLSLTLSGKENAQPFNSQLNYPLLLDIINTIETYYVDDVSEDELINAAIGGIFKKLDPYSDFLDTDAYSDMRDANKGEYFGFGIEIAVSDDKVTIISPFPHSPAEKAGIQAGDQIVKINDTPVSAEELESLLKEIRHHSTHDLSLSLTLSHQGSDSEFEVALKPSIIAIQSVSAKLLPDHVGYIRLASFQHNSTKEMIAQLTAWQSHSLRGIVLDLRNNPGGLLDEAISIADLFLEKGRIVSTQGRFFDANSDYYASPQAMMSKVPLLVLINKGSASASEVLAAALQDNGRATLIGEQSFGKGTVQSLIPTLIEGNAIKLTIAKYTTPNGNDINSVGIAPDILFDPATMTEQQSVPIISGLTPHDSMVDTAITWINNSELNDKGS
ncbi:S41 family peptidase [Shewanella waksmanii]|uniref:S41 family peptidase n=1 Tax=Shewanella waksmanii TaxID=213783 RepID=UPI003734FB03